MSITFPKPEEILPHRPPFLFVDEITDMVSAESVSGRWTSSEDDWFYPGHFPGRPTLPGVLMLEAMAQIGAYLVLSQKDMQGKLPLFGRAGNVKFKRQVLPGETLDIVVELSALRARVGKGAATARVGDDVACEAELTFAIVDRD